MTAKELKLKTKGITEDQFFSNSLVASTKTLLKMQKHPFPGHSWRSPGAGFGNAALTPVDVAGEAVASPAFGNVPHVKHFKMPITALWTTTMNILTWQQAHKIDGVLEHTKLGQEDTQNLHTVGQTQGQYKIHRNAFF